MLSFSHWRKHSIARFTITTDTKDPIAVPGCIPTAHFITADAAINRSGVVDNVTAKARMKVIRAVSCAKLPPRNIPPQELKALRSLQVIKISLCFQLTRAGYGGNEQNRL